jgi:hypothetical protein
VKEVVPSHFFKIISSKGLGVPFHPIIHIFVIKGVEALEELSVGLGLCVGRVSL